MLNNNTELYSFVIIVMLMIMTPGANQILVLQSGLVLGHKAAIYNVLGISASMFVHATITGLGISIVIMQSPGLYQAVKMVGAGYIAYLAMFSLYSAYLLRDKAADAENGVVAKLDTTGETAVNSFTKGFTSNVLNIHTSMVFLSIFPQYMDPEKGLYMQSLFLTLVFIGLLLCWYTLIIALILKVRKYLLQPRIQLRIKVVTGSLLLVMAVRMLLRQ